jgi:hypothetical protein
VRFHDLPSRLARAPFFVKDLVLLEPGGALSVTAGTLRRERGTSAPAPPPRRAIRDAAAMASFFLAAPSPSSALHRPPALRDADILLSVKQHPPVKE